MRIATTTLFSPLNYGNALQMLSLHRYLCENGYDADVLRHYLSKDCNEFKYYIERTKTIKSFIRFFLESIQLNWSYSQYRREKKINKWLKQNFHWSIEEGDDNSFNVEKLPYDLIITGSDQIWNPNYNWPDFYLLNHFPSNIKRVAYAASFGTDQTEAFDINKYKSSLKKFYAISVREISAKRIIKDLFGLESIFVCDPTLLHTKEEWCKILNIKKKSIKDHILIYYVTPDFRERYKELINLATETGKIIDFYAFPIGKMPTVSINKFVSFLKKTIINIIFRIKLYLSGVRVHFTASPKEFVEGINSCSGIITDSFHGMMFATIFEKPCNIVLSDNKQRVMMKSRLLDFINEFSDINIVTSYPNYRVMKQLTITPKLQKLISLSKKWLDKTIRELENQ